MKSDSPPVSQSNEARIQRVNPGFRLLYQYWGVGIRGGTGLHRRGWIVVNLLQSCGPRRPESPAVGLWLPAADLGYPPRPAATASPPPATPAHYQNHSQL